MRLLNTKTLQFEKFMNPRACSYAIVSHRWTNKEVTIQDFPRYLAGEDSGYGWTKVQHGCEIARSQGYEWLWLDTCCINQDSSAELSEAINSMFRWYQAAKVCYVFLRDVRNTDDRGNDFSSLPIFRARSQTTGMYEEEFKRSEWFRRGWTLQELLAPRELKFFNNNFQCVGTRGELSALIAAATAIDRLYVEQPLSFNVLQDISIAERMRWVSNRQTTKEEDMAYCLLGLFDVNMPLLYGEGKKAFIRLQLELLKKTDDESIFAWDRHPSFHPSDGLLASNPAAFQNRATIHDPMLFHYPHSMTNKGLQMTLDIPDSWEAVQSPQDGRTGSDTAMAFNGMRYQKEHTVEFLLPLNCTTYAKNKNGIIEAHAIAIAFQATVLKSNIAFLGYRMGKLQLIPGSGKGWLPEQDELGRVNNPIMIGKDTATKPWTVYFPQKGL